MCAPNAATCSGCRQSELIQTVLLSVLIHKLGICWQIADTCFNYSKYDTTVTSTKSRGHSCSSQWFLVFNKHFKLQQKDTMPTSMPSSPPCNYYLISRFYVFVLANERYFLVYCFVILLYFQYGIQFITSTKTLSDGGGLKWSGRG